MRKYHKKHEVGAKDSSEYEWNASKNLKNATKDSNFILLKEFADVMLHENGALSSFWI